MYLAGFFGTFELLITGAVILLFVAPLIVRKVRGPQNYTEKLDQLERLERMYRDGSISEREFKKQKRKILKRKA